jgi:hypothetical protein
MKLMLIIGGKFVVLSFTRLGRKKMRLHKTVQRTQARTQFCVARAAIRWRISYIPVI